MRIKVIKDVDFQNYKKISMFIGTSLCNWKCCIEQGLSSTICQNNALVKSKTVSISNEKLCDMYLKNEMTKAIVIGGLEPFLQFDELLNFVSIVREYVEDDIVIYTGYYETEIKKEIEQLSSFSNIIIKFGRFKLNEPDRLDNVLGVTLASKNQYGKKIS